MRLLLAAAIFGILSGAANCEDAAPSIRQFDVATVEKLGREMYRLDQEAWKATDILMAAHPRDELSAQKLHGWIVVSHEDGDVVRFVHDGAQGPELFYDVTFPKVGAPSLSEPKDRTLNGVERAMYDARTLAVQNTDPKCSDTYNTIVLKDPEQAGWLVWVMAATKSDRDAVILGGHTRFTISADGNSIRQKDPLSHTCQQYSRAKGPNGEDAEIITTQVVSQVPVETSVFASLSYKMTIRVGTNDGKAWKIEDDSITNIDMDMPGVDGFAARALGGFDESCNAVIDDGNGKRRVVPVKSVIELTEHAEKYVPDLSTGAKAALISCARGDFYLAPNDYKVLFDNVPFQVMHRNADGSIQSGSLYVEKGQFKFATEKGTVPSEAQQKAIQARLDQFQLKPWPKD
jgi:hypothetical protein